ncbi:4-(cytidine 5'-diphospho)-2-C-methyl-D-erythritol kinase [Nocardioides panacis]|uniref:4-diphosphocytidyl-2-C-methyl-D-erythritol kinase n=1 Tax=Nocardioides panacis TaxID=2849501 RepID=A0A975Y0D4_9ACTN|nr:4-(cytidine 5'-diphospho)-2-C-methyl-D-erythritol kinase [Nocardioides panacis]QWZ08361.1 4-(cytidine 5'-diphospho)-2-C-methyl-D-erythritol kinase [Nocardioides panacis]
MSGAVTAAAPAKINLSLGVGTRRPDGFHPLATVYQAIGLYDRVTVTDADDLTVSVTAQPRIPVDGVPLDDTNIAVRAARTLREHHGGIRRGAHLAIDKGIPVAGGMAGGSADAAAALLALDHLWGLGTPRAELMRIAAGLGSDVPFALVGGTAIGSGRGEVVVPLITVGEYWWVVLESERGLSTPSVYDEFDVLRDGSSVPDPEIPDALMTALRVHDVAALGASLSNDLQVAALRLRPELARALEQGRLESAHGAIVSGSGPSCLFLCEGRSHAVQVAGGLRSLDLGPVSFAPGPVHGARVVTTDDGRV